MSENPRRDAAAYATAWAKLLPTGPAWPRERESVLMRFLDGQAGVWANPVDARSHDLLDIEALPDTTDELLDDWERVAGLPEPCYVDLPLSDTERRTRLVEKLTTEGGQSRAYFLALAHKLGYANASIEEFSPFRCGGSRCGRSAQRVMSPLMRFWWRMFIGPATLVWFRAGRGKCGRDPQARINRAKDIECIVKQRKPAHTDVIFTYQRVPEEPLVLVWFRAGKSRVGRDPQADISNFHFD